MILVPQRPREDMRGSLWFRSRQRWEPRAGILTAGDNAYEHLFICGEAACERSGENDGTETVPDTQLGPLAFRRAGAQLVPRNYGQPTIVVAALSAQAAYAALAPTRSASASRAWRVPSGCPSNSRGAAWKNSATASCVYSSLPDCTKRGNRNQQVKVGQQLSNTAPIVGSSICRWQTA